MTRLLAITTLLAVCLFGQAQDPSLVLVQKGQGQLPVIMPADPAPFVKQGAADLVSYIEQISGAKLELIEGVPEPLPERAIWVGYQPVLDQLLPEVNFTFEHPEEILLAANERHLVVAGRDRQVGDTWMEHGTSCAVYVFLEDYLDVRWLWPAPGGTDIIPSETIALEPFTYRYHPQFGKRHLWPRWMRDWYRAQRIYEYSYPFGAGHAYTDWWEKYHEEHPDWFALSKGTREPPFWGDQRNPKGVKLCVSNPEVAAQWIDNTVALLEADPTRVIVSASPNDGPGFCTCENCRAMDHPDADPRVLTERYVKYWNTLARGLRERLPDRDADVGAYAYSIYREPPVEEKLEPNIAVGFVGSFPFAGEAVIKQQKEDWLAWAELATKLVYRPNLFHSSGGFEGMPNVMLRQTAEDWRFLAENKGVGIEVDTLPNFWATQGPQYYLMAQLTYDPWQDAEALMDDYYQRGFGPAAPEMKQYWTLLEETCEHSLDLIWNDDGSGRLRRDQIGAVLGQVWGNPELIAEARSLLDQATGKVADSRPIYTERIAYFRHGLDFVEVQANLLRALAKVEETQGGDREALERAIQLTEQKEALIKAGPRYAVRGTRGALTVEELRERYAVDGAQPLVQLAQPQWELAWTEDFKRQELGDAWTVKEGSWEVVDGQLVSQGGKLVSNRTFDGLQRIEMKATMTPNPMGVISDLSPMLHLDEKGRGYLMQVGGYHNTMSSIQRLGKVTVEKKSQPLTPGKTHTITAELSGNIMRILVDGELLVEQVEKRPLIGSDHQRIGFYIYAGTARIDEIKVFTAEPVRMVEGVNIPDDPDAF